MHLSPSAVLDIYLVHPDGTKINLVGQGYNTDYGFRVDTTEVLQTGDVFELRHSLTGGLVGRCPLDQGILADGSLLPGFIFEPSMLADLNCIGQPPEPTAQILLPPNTERIVVGMGSMNVAGAAVPLFGPTLNVVHEQYWRRGKDSYSLSAGQTKTVTIEQVTGMTLSTETEENLNAIVGVTMSGSMGPFSASLSASVTYSSTSRARDTLSVAQTTVTEGVVTNPTSAPMTVFSWELVDVYFLFNSRKKIIIENVQSPPLLRLYVQQTAG